MSISTSLREFTEAERAAVAEIAVWHDEELAKIRALDPDALPGYAPDNAAFYERELAAAQKAIVAEILDTIPAAAEEKSAL